MKRFGIICLTAVFLFCSFGCVEAQQDKALPKVEFVKGDDKIDVMIGGEHIASPFSVNRDLLLHFFAHVLRGPVGQDHVGVDAAPQGHLP